MEQEAASATPRHLHAVPPPRDQAPVPPLREQAPGTLSRVDAAPAVQDLLAQLDDLRLVLSTDLGLAASAVDADELAVARDVIAGAQDDLAVFGVRAGHALREPGAPTPLPAAPSGRRRRHRLSLLAPSLTAAAALAGVLLGVVPSTTAPAAPDTSIATDAMSSWDALRRLHEQGAPAERLARAARQLHAELGRLVGAGASPAAVTEALRLLELQRRVLSDPEHADELRDELADSQRLVAALRATVLGSPAGTVLADAPLPAPAAPPAALPASSPADGVQRGVRELPAPAPSDPAPAPAPAPGDRPRPAAVPVPAPAPDQPSDTGTAAAGPAAGPTAPAEQQPAPDATPSASPSSGAPTGTSTGAPTSTSAGAPTGTPTGAPAGPSAGTTTSDDAPAAEASAPPSASPAPVLAPRASGTLLPE